MPGTSLDLLLVSFSFLGRCLLPVLIFLLLFLVGVVLLVLLCQEVADGTQHSDKILNK